MILACRFLRTAITHLAAAPEFRRFRSSAASVVGSFAWSAAILFVIMPVRKSWPSKAWWTPVVPRSCSFCSSCWAGVQESFGAGGRSRWRNGMRTFSDAWLRYLCARSLLDCAARNRLQCKRSFPRFYAAETIVANMVAQGKWNDNAVRSFDELRLFRASNRRFKQEATREVRTTFHAPDSYNSIITEKEQRGSLDSGARIRSDLLEPEKGAAKKEKLRYDILPANYEFRVAGVDSCGERKCYRVAISPRRKDKFLLEGFIWVDAEDYGIAKVQGTPSKKLSFWTLKTG